MTATKCGSSPEGPRTGRYFWCVRIAVVVISSGSSRNSAAKEPRTTPGHSTRSASVAARSDSDSIDPPTAVASSRAPSRIRRRRASLSGSTWPTRSFWRKSSGPETRIGNSERTGWPTVRAPEATPRSSIGTTFPAKSATTPRTGRTKDRVASPHRIVLGNVIAATARGTAAASTSAVALPGMVRRAATVGPRGESTTTSSETCTSWARAKPRAALVGWPSASNAAEAGGPSTSENRSSCFSGSPRRIRIRRRGEPKDSTFAATSPSSASPSPTSRAEVPPRGGHDGRRDLLRPDLEEEVVGRHARTDARAPATRKLKPRPARARWAGRPAPAPSGTPGRTRRRGPGPGGSSPRGPWRKPRRGRRGC